jgi:hypothetical protein
MGSYPALSTAARQVANFGTTETPLVPFAPPATDTIYVIH